MAYTFYAYLYICERSLNSLSIYGDEINLNIDNIQNYTLHLPHYSEKDYDKHFVLTVFK